MTQLVDIERFIVLKRVLLLKGMLACVMGMGVLLKHVFH